MTEIDFALQQENDSDKIELVGTVLWNKANAKGHFTKLSEPEQTFVFIDIFESEINNNGVLGFFYNSSGEYAHQTLQAYQNIKAYNTATILNTAICVFESLPIPKNIFQRRQAITTLHQNAFKIWSELDYKLITDKDDLLLLLINYIAAHKTDFEY